NLPPSLYNFYASDARLRFLRRPKEVVFHPSDNTTVLLGPDLVFPKSFRAEVVAVGPKDIERLSAQVRQSSLPRPIKCLVGEYTISARDNGYALFTELKCPSKKPDDL